MHDYAVTGYQTPQPVVEVAFYADRRYGHPTAHAGRQSLS